MLINPKILSKSLKNLETRNQLIKKLNNPHYLGDIKNRYYFVLIFWLGSNSAIFKIEDEAITNQYLNYIYKGYYLILILEKALYLHDPASNAFMILDHAVQDIMALYNKNYLLLTQNP